MLDFVEQLGALLYATMINSYLRRLPDARRMIGTGAPIAIAAQFYVPHARRGEVKVGVVELGANRRILRPTAAQLTCCHRVRCAIRRPRP